VKIHQLACVAVLGLLAAGCPTFANAPGAAFAKAPPSPGKATVYFYRPAQKIMSDYPFFMSLPESANNCFRLESGGYTAFVTDPGQVTVAGMMIKYSKKTFDLKAGEERYVEIQISDDDAVMAEVSAAEAQPKLAATRGINTCTEQVKAK